jgi:tetratricopeptide (TPR) repeat protein
LPKPTIFISHAHRDQLLAQAMQDALEACFGEGVEVRRSSKAGEISSGANWIDWIHEQVQQCDSAIVLLTPASIHSPWVLYESGGVDGVSRALSTTERGHSRRLSCISFLRSPNELPEFFKYRKVVDGRAEDDLLNFLSETIESFTSHIAPKVRTNALINLKATAAEFVIASRRALLRTPLERSEAMILEWCDRIDKLVAQKKPEQAADLRRMARMAFFGEVPGDERSWSGKGFLDVRLHRRFGEVFFGLKKYDQSAEEYRAALEVAPRDIFLRHRLALCLINAGSYPQAKQELDNIEVVDPGIAAESEDIATLRARYFSELENFPEAIAALRRFHGCGKSYYILNNIAVYGMRHLNTITKDVEDDFRACRKVAEDKADSDFWARATLINCLLALREDGDAARHLYFLRRESETPSQIEAAGKHYDAILDRRHGGRGEFNWREAASVGVVQPIKAANN